MDLAGILGYAMLLAKYSITNPKIANNLESS